MRKAALALPWVLALLAGCATPGPLHVYSLEPGAAKVTDTGGERAADVPSHLEPEDHLTGFAYDPYTDHFFLRLEPGNRIRVVDRPARKIKREFEINELGAGGDLAIRPRDGHVFFLESRPVRVVETSRLGKRIRAFDLEGVTAPAGIACDLAQHRLLVLHGDGRNITAHDLEGRKVGALRLEQPAGASLAFDSERRELFAPLASAPNAIGVFDLDGKLLRCLERVPGRFVDVGPRSFVRVF